MLTIHQVVSFAYLSPLQHRRQHRQRVERAAEAGGAGGACRRRGVGGGARPGRGEDARWLWRERFSFVLKVWYRPDGQAITHNLLFHDKSWQMLQRLWNRCPFVFIHSADEGGPSAEVIFVTAPTSLSAAELESIRTQVSTSHLLLRHREQSCLAVLRVREGK